MGILLGFVHYIKSLFKKKSHPSELVWKHNTSGLIAPEENIALAIHENGISGTVKTMIHSEIMDNGVLHTVHKFKNGVFIHRYHKDGKEVHPNGYTE